MNDETVSSRHGMIRDILAARSPLSHSDIAKKLGQTISVATLNRDLVELEKQGIVSVIGDARARFYSLSSNTSKPEVTPDPQKSAKNQSNLPPLVSFSVSNPITYLKLWWNKVIGNEGVDIHLRIHPLTAIAMGIGILGLGTGLGFGAGWSSALSKAPLIGKYVVIPTPIPTANPWRDTAFSGTVRFNNTTKHFYLLTASDEAITLDLPSTIDLKPFIGRRIFAPGFYNESAKTLKVIDATELEVLPTTIQSIPTVEPTSTPSANPSGNL